jgi:Flp pilus assembly protein TadD
MSDEPVNERDEARLAAVLRALDAVAAPVDRDALDALRTRATQAFDEQGSESPAERASQNDEPKIVLTVTRERKRRSMTSLFIRGMIAVGGLAAAIAVCLNLVGPPRLTGAAPFSEVVDELRGQKTLELKVTKEGKSADVWICAPGLVRWQDSPQRYKIAAGSRLWRIDESTNTVTTGDSPWFANPKQQIDLVGLLDVGVTESAPLIKARAVDRTEFDGRDCFVYRVDLPAKQGRIEVAAYADASSKQLVGLVAQPAGGPANAPPLAELHLVAVNSPVDESKFVVAKSLTDDGRIGKVTDAQGVVVVRPALAQRWTPVGREMPLRVGDWLRTDIRGANAVRVHLSSEVELTLGPGTLIECVSPVLARLHSGEVQVNLPKQEHPQFELLAPREGSRKFAETGKSIVRVDRAAERLADVKESPKWLQGFQGATADESLGSLIVNIDGLYEPLAVGYHKVSVEIRDQVARTTIEESFVNSTAARLEGVFHFPLPQDASISDFGMWIGNNLVEADIVEKQRAREIYETILRERRDPGLLEWTGGSIFKARVFPIEAFSEKRIKIVYTQVLPVRANKYRYTYALRSELLRKTPLRELSLNVSVNSALPLKSVRCPTHDARLNETAHSAQVAFAAQEYTPTRDFEVVCEIDGRQSDVVVIPHRRGDDGYFMVQLTPPATESNWQRELVADGKPLELVLLCDTSASMDSEKRKQQAEFVATLLSSLGEKDHFWLAAADVSTDWASKEPLAATSENMAKARDFLDHRLSLGWTNLEQGFEAVGKKAHDGAQVIYIGDGIVTAGRADPVNFVNKLGRMFAGDRAKVFYAVTVGNSFESTVLKAIAAVGGGSVRSIGGEQTPQSVALELLKEIASPGLRDLNVEFRGLKAAAVYPDRLPNLAAGTQQILVGRYLPTGSDQQGEIVVTGRRGSEPVRYAAKIDLKDAELGNSFIPRLWARAHLDHLLAQGQSQAVRDQIIGLSEEFHIITPYTSLLVLETDADRERFGIKRRFAMRNGEQFFAEGHDNAMFELTQQQMKRAGDWRIGLRRQVLAMLARQGRDPHMFERRRQLLGLNRYAGLGGGDGVFHYQNGEMPFDYGGQAERLLDEFEANGPMSSPMGGSLSLGDESGRIEAREDFFGRLNKEEAEVDRKSMGMDLDGFAGDQEGLGVGLRGALEAGQGIASPEEGSVDDSTPLDDSESMRFASVTDSPVALDFNSPIAGKPMSYRGLGGELSYFLRRPYGYGPNYTAWLDTLFPSLLPPDRTQPPPKKSREGWSPEVIELARSLLRIEALKKLDGGIELRTMSDTFDPRWNRRTSHHRDLSLYSPTAWLTRSLDTNTNTIINYCDKQERGVFSLALLLGRVRKSIERDLATPPLSLSDLSLTRIEEAYSSYEARVEKGDAADQVVLILKAKNSDYVQRLTIDTARHVLLKIATLDRGKVTGTTTFSDFAEIAGTWWARRLVITDEKARTIGETTLEITAVAAAKYSDRIAAELTSKPRVQFLRLPLPKLKDALQRVADASAAFDDRIVMMLHDSVLQQWDELLRQLDLIEKTAADKPGVRWLRPIIWATIRRNDEARQRLLEEAGKLADKKQQDELYLAGFLVSQAQGFASPAEYLEFVERLKPVYDRQPAELDAKSLWQDLLAGAYDRLGRTEDALAIKRTLAEQSPWDVNRQTDYARRLSQAGRPVSGREWLQKQLDRREERTPSEDESLRTTITDLYRSEGRYDELLKFTTAWIERKPETQAAYQQHLSALVYNDRLDEANALAERWLKEAQIEGKLSGDQTTRLEAAITFAQGSAYDLSFYRMDERWFEPLAEAIRYFGRSKDKFGYVGRIMDYRFGESDAADRVRGDFLKLLETEVDKLSPEQVNGLVGRTLSGRLELTEPINGRKQLGAGEVPDEVWKKIAERIYARWQDTSAKKAADDKRQLGEALRSIYAARFDDKLLPFLRERIAAAEIDYKGTYISNLFDTLLSRPWTEKVESEAFALLPRLSDADETGDRLMVEVPALYRLVDAMLANRQNAAMQELRDKEEVDKLTRTELAKKKAEFRKAAQERVAKRLAEAAAEHNNSSLAPWLRIERAYLDISLDQRLAEVEAECWQILGDAPPSHDLDAEAAEQLSPAKIRERYFDSILRNRAFVTVMNLSARKNAAAASIDRLIKFVDAGIALGGDQAGPWRTAKLQLLVALDRPDDLERELRQWIRADVSTAPWRKALAMLLAERAKFDEPISLFEAAEKDHLLTAADYRTLADWYLIVNRREAHDRARIESFKQIPEHILGNMFYTVRSRWLRTDLPLPSELDENTLLAMKALFEKSASPDNYFWQLRELYTACRDFRLLQMLPDAVLGRSPQQIYSFLQNLQSQVLSEVHNESTTDEIIARVKKLREGKLTPTDLRALDLMEAIIERRAAEVLNQRGPHVEASLAALKRAFDRPWSDGEPRLMAAFLRSLDKLPDPKLIDEQIRELKALAEKAPAASRDHLEIVKNLAELLFWSYGRHDEALAQMEIEVRSYEQAHDGHWPFLDDEALGSYISMLESAHQYAAGETLLFKYSAKPEHEQQKTWLANRLLQLYNAAIEGNGEVSLGRSSELFAAVVKEHLRRIDAAADENERYNVVASLASTFEIAHRHKLSGVADSLRTFTFEKLPAILKKQHAQYQNTANAPRIVVETVLGPRVALQYVVERMEQYPQWLEIGWQNGWTTFGNEMARLREATANSKQNIEDLEPRVLKLTIRELKRDLRTGERRAPDIYFVGHPYYWAAKVGDFAMAADEVYREHKSSGRRVMYVAQYLWSGLFMQSRAIEMLLAAHRDGNLDEGQQMELVNYLQQANRYGESIAILEPLVNFNPRAMNYRTRLMAAYFHTQQPKRLAELVAETDKFFHKNGLWNEGNIAEFGRGALECRLYEKSAGYLKEAISLHQRANSGAVLGDAGLSGMYQQLADAYSGLSKTKEAVDAASASIVCWGPNYTQRADAIKKLKDVLAAAKDLDTYVKQLDEETGKSKQDSPVIRKALGQTYQSTGKFDKAVAELQIAVQLQPNDTETHQALIACYDAIGKKHEATLELLALIDLDHHNLALYQQLAERMKDDEAEAERAATSIIEAGPNEAENQAAMAELRQKQGRWREAIDHWREAAELRRLEPTNLIKLIEAELHAKQWQAARESLDKLQKTEWPSRFANVQNDLRRLLNELPKGQRL